MRVYFSENLENLNTDLVSELLKKEILQKDELRRVNRYYYHPQGVRRCSECQEVLSATSENFYVKKYHKNSKGEITNIGLSACCKSCDKKYQAIDKRKQRENPELYCRRVIPGLRFRAKEQSVPFDLNGEQLFKILNNQNFNCYYTGEPLDFSVEEGTNNYPNRMMPSVDKIDPNLGYVENNVAWTFYYVNRMKNDLNFKEFIELCQKVIRNTGQESGVERHQ